MTVWFGIASSMVEPDDRLGAADGWVTGADIHVLIGWF